LPPYPLFFTLQPYIYGVFRQILQKKIDIFDFPGTTREDLPELRIITVRQNKRFPLLLAVLARLRL
jgi:hypothetical protein